MNPDQISALGRHAEIMTAVYDRINNHHKKPLHSGQIQLAKDYFTRGMRVTQSQWGRNGGKTESALFIASVACLLFDNFTVMIVCPELKQGKKIYWQSKRLQHYPPPQFVKDYGTSELKVEFNNNSIITIEGCENYNALRGVKPDLVIYDEFQDHSKEFHLEVMQPNLLAKQSSLLIYGTPPKQRSAYYVEFRDQLLKQIKDGDVTRSYYEFPTEINPQVDKTELHKVRKELLESGNEAIWYREYEGKSVFGGEDVVFPMWNPKPSVGTAGHIRRHDVLMSYLEQDKSKLKWYTICDPGTSTCFAVLFICYNPFTQQIFVMDEIYEKDRARTNSKQIWERIRKKEEELYPGSQINSWRRVYDEAAAWFHGEISALYRGTKVSLAPSQKKSSDPETDISRIKMAMSQAGAFVVSDRCYWLRWEIESYITIVDKNGDSKYQEHNDHLLDCLKYFMQTSGWNLMERAEEILHNEAGVSKHIQKMDPTEWADTVVGGSLETKIDDYYSEYFH